MPAGDTSLSALVTINLKRKRLRSRSVTSSSGDSDISPASGDVVDLCEPEEQEPAGAAHWHVNRIDDDGDSEADILPANEER